MMIKCDKKLNKFYLFIGGCEICSSADYKVLLRTRNYISIEKPWTVSG